MNKPIDVQRLGSVLRKLPLLLMLLCMCVGTVACLNGTVSVDELVDALSGRPYLVGGVLLLLYVVKGLSGGILYGVLVAAAGLLYPLPQALLLNLLGTALCVTVPYLIGRLNKSERIWQKIESNRALQKVYDGRRGHLVGLCLMLRSLGLQSEILGLLFGVLNMRFVPYLLASVIPMAPGMICVTIFGNTLDFSSVWFWVCLGIDLTMILTVNVIYWRGRLKKRASEQNTCESTEESEHEVSQG